MYSASTNSTIAISSPISASLISPSHNVQDTVQSIHSPASSSETHYNTSSNNFLSLSTSDIIGISNMSNVTNNFLSKSGNHAAAIAAGIIAPQPIRNNSPYHLRNGEPEERLHSILDYRKFINILF